MNREHKFAKAWKAAAKKKLNNSCLTMSITNIDIEEPSPGEICHVENVLPTGDFYTGEWWNNVPHGNGKFLWTDGCMHFGRWNKGKMTGKGRFSWPSGATYEGEFKAGYMDGKGTFTGSLGYTYRGHWVMNFKHGRGTKSYGNGDYYDGDWRRGSHEGHGKYQWKSGNLYIGQWRNGKMHGSGTMIWENGDRYDGSWEDGFPKGNGTFKWADGSFYVGIWSQDSKERNVTYYPSSSLTGNLDWDPQELFSLLEDCKVCPCEKVPVFPSQKLPNWSEMDVGECKLLEGGRLSDPGWGSDSDCDIVEDPLLRIQPARRQGETISKGHKNYELMLNLQLGIRHAVGRPGPPITLDLKSSAFDPKEKLWTKFPPEGSKHTPPHQSSDFKWKDYCPLVFRTLRKLFNVDAADYMISICGDNALRELSSPGKSGSFFYLTHDDKYMIKTMKKAEAKVLIRMLPAYYNHVKSFGSTLVTKFFGLHCVRCGSAQKKVRFIIMGNLFCTDYGIHRRFDLKGSSHGRTTSKPESEIDATTTLKDLDLNFMFRLHKTWFQDFCRQVDKDCELLEQERIMDYSMLVGLHFREVSRRNTPHSGAGNGDAGQNGSTDQLLLDQSRLSSIKLGIEMPATVEKTVRKNEGEAQLVGEPTGELYEVILFFSIIDILQDYDISKKLEHAYKSMHYDPTSISAVDPKQYSRRFRDFIFRVFVEDS